MWHNGHPWMEPGLQSCVLEKMGRHIPMFKAPVKCKCTLCKHDTPNRSVVNPPAAVDKKKDSRWGAAVMQPWPQTCLSNSFELKKIYIQVYMFLKNHMRWKVAKFLFNLAGGHKSQAIFFFHLLLSYHLWGPSYLKKKISSEVKNPCHHNA